MLASVGLFYVNSRSLLALLGLFCVNCVSLLALVGLSSCACCVCVCVFVCVCEAGNNRSLLRLYQASFDTCAMRRRTNMGSCLLFGNADTVSLT